MGEGQAYGMLAGAAVGDQQRFDRISSWTRDNILQSDGLLAFRWVGGRVVDPHPAADADLDAARALLLGACRFHRPDLRTAAVRIGRVVLTWETARAGSIHVRLAGPGANMRSHLVFNPSYVDPTTLHALATAPELAAGQDDHPKRCARRKSGSACGEPQVRHVRRSDRRC